MFEYARVLKLLYRLTRFQVTSEKINRDYGVGKHNHPGHRSDVYDDNRHCDDNVDDDVLGSCSDTYIKWSTECPNRMLDDENAI